jgi:hypothetical protein
MNAKRRRVSHLVRVARIRVETALVEIEGDDKDDEEAERQAIEKAQLFSDDVWVMQPFDESAYRPHVQSMISREELAELTKEGRSADAARSPTWAKPFTTRSSRRTATRARASWLCSPGSRSMSPICSPPTSAAGGSMRWRTSG